MTDQKPICASCSHLSIVPIIFKGQPGFGGKMVCALNRPGVGKVMQCNLYIREPGADDE